MKKWLCIFLLICWAGGMGGCVQAESKVQSPFVCYYRLAQPAYGTADGVIAWEYQDAAGHEDNYVYLLTQYLKGPASESLTSPFPKGTALYTLDILGDTAYVELSDSFASLTGIDLTIGCACLTQTVLAMTGCKAVVISAASAMLDGSKTVTMTADSWLLLDDSATSATE